MRASHLQDLVYKNGQAGVTKASVSINFDNSDKKRSPLGFETNDEITVTRQVSLKYLYFLITYIYFYHAQQSGRGKKRVIFKVPEFLQ